MIHYTQVNQRKNVESSVLYDKIVCLDLMVILLNQEKKAMDCSKGLL